MLSGWNKGITCFTSGGFINQYIQSLEHSFSSREKWPENELNELLRLIWTARFWTEYFWLLNEWNEIIAGFTSGDLYKYTWNWVCLYHMLYAVFIYLKLWSNSFIRRHGFKWHHPARHSTADILGVSAIEVLLLLRCLWEAIIRCSGIATGG